MNLKRFGVICIVVGAVGEALAAQAWWWIGQNIVNATGWILAPQFIADLLDEAGSVIWLGIALLIVAYAEKK